MRKIIIVFVACLVSSVAWGRATASLNLTEGTTDDQFILTITIEGSLDDELRLPTIPGVRIVDQRQSTQVNLSFGGGRSVNTRETTYSFYLAMDKPGTYQIPSLQLEVNGKKESTLPLSFTVQKASAPTRTSANNAIFIERTIAKSTAYVGEEIVVTNRIFSSKDLQKAQINQPEDGQFKAFTVKGEQHFSKVIDGQTYDVLEFQSVIVPQKPGPLFIPSLTLEALVIDENRSQQRRPRSQIDDFFGGSIFGGMFSNRGQWRQVKVSSEELKLQISDLPVEGRPQDFTGLVGQFELKPSFSQSNVTTGDTATLEITLSGHGYTEGAESLQPTFDKSLKVYPDQPQHVQNLTKTGFQNREVFKYALVPTQPGTISAGSVGLSYFDPKTKTYKSLKTDLGQLTVTGAPIAAPSASETVGAKKTDIAVAKDLLPLHTPEQLDHTPKVSKFIGVVLLLVCCVAWGSGLLMLAWKLLSGQAARFKGRSPTPLAKLESELKKAKDLLASDPNEGLHVADRVLRQYLHAQTQERQNILRKVCSDVEASLYSGRRVDAARASELIDNARQAILREEHS